MDYRTGEGNTKRRSSFYHFRRRWVEKIQGTAGQRRNHTGRVWREEKAAAGT